MIQKDMNGLKRTAAQIKMTENLQLNLLKADSIICYIRRSKMKIQFIKTKNVKKFTALMDELQNLPPNVPKMALVYGSCGLGKSETEKSLIAWSISIFEPVKE